MRDCADDLAATDPLAAQTGAELRRRLVLASGLRETHPAVGERLLSRHHGAGQPGGFDTALVLCTDWGWRRTTGELITRIAASELLSTAELDDLAEQFLRPEIAIEVPAEWFAAGFDIPLDGAAVPARVANPTRPVITRRQVRPPLRRWAAARRLRHRDGSAEELEEAITELDAAGAAAVVQGTCDAVDSLDSDTAERVLDKAARWPRAQVRKLAYEHMTARGDEVRARRLAEGDPDAKLRQWAARTEISEPSLFDG